MWTSGCLSYTALRIGATWGSQVCLPGMAGPTLQVLRGWGPISHSREVPNIATWEKDT